MPLLKNVAGQKVAVFAYDVAAGAGKTGDQANITAQISKDFGASAALADTNPDQLDAANHPGWYVFDLDQAETNADAVILTVSSITAGIKFAPMVIYPTVYDTTKAGYLDAGVSTRSTLTAQQVWEYATRTLSSFGTLVADAAAAVWGAITRSLTDKAGFTISGTKQTLDALQDLSQAGAQAGAAAALTAQGYTTARAPYLDELAAANLPADVDGIKGKTVNLPTDPADQSAIEAAITAAVSSLAVEANVQTHAAAAITAYDPPTRAEATADKDEVIAAMPGAVDLTALTALVTRALGLAGENMVMDQTVFDADRKLTSARVRIYDSSAHALAAGDTGLIATFPLTLTWATKLLETMTQVIS